MNTVKRALTPHDTNEAAEAPSMDDSNRTFRTRLVAFWLLTNGALAISIQFLNGMAKSNSMVNSCLQDAGVDPKTGSAHNGSVMVQLNATCIEHALNFDNSELQDKQQYYFQGLLWATAGLSAIRFLGVSH